MSAFVLYFIRSPVARLGGVVAFTTLFSVVMAVIARAKRAECFAATTALVLLEHYTPLETHLLTKRPRLQVFSCTGCVRMQRRPTCMSTYKCNLLPSLSRPDGEFSPLFPSFCERMRGCRHVDFTCVTFAMLPVYLSIECPTQKHGSFATEAQSAGKGANSTQSGCLRARN